MASEWAPTFPGTADDLGAQADGAIVLAVGIESHLGRKDAGLEHVLHLAVGVYVAGQHLEREKGVGAQLGQALQMGGWHVVCRWQPDRQNTIMSRRNKNKSAKINFTLLAASKSMERVRVRFPAATPTQFSQLLHLPVIRT